MKAYFVGAGASLCLLALAKTGGYEPVTTAPLTMSTTMRVSSNTPEPTPYRVPMVADIKFSKPLARGMYVTFWTSPVASGFEHAGVASRFGTPKQTILGLAPALFSFDPDQSWFAPTSSRRGKVKILKETTLLKMSFGLQSRGSKARKKNTFIFHYVVRDTDYDTVLDSGSKFITLTGP